MRHFTVRAASGAVITLPAREDLTLMQSLYLSGRLEAPALCSGLGSCGLCRVRVTGPPGAQLPAQPEDFQVLGEKAVAQGWRLGCRHQPRPGLVLELPQEVREAAEESEARPAHPKKTWLGQQLLAIDFGSTSLYASCEDKQARNQQGEAWPEDRAMRLPNPQRGAGADIMSRLAWAAQQPEAAAQLSRLSRAALGRFLEFCPDAAEICLAANPAMVSLLLQKNPAGLATAPYRLDYLGGEREELPALPPLWVCPLVSPFIGGDLSAGYAALALDPRKAAPEFPFLLADMGTNGEFILAIGPEQALAASLPLGPALEGIGMRCGAEAGPGVINAFSLTPEGLSYTLTSSPISSPTPGPTSFLTPPSQLCSNLSPSAFPEATQKLAEGGGRHTEIEPPHGISGTGYLSLLGILRSTGLMDAAGHLRGVQPPSQGQPLTPLGAKLLPRLKPSPHGDPAFYATENLYLSARDIEELLKIKAAFSLALKILLREAQLTPAALKTLFLAGALGRHARPENLAGLAFYPVSLQNRVKPVGNSSLAGARLLATHPELRPELKKWCRCVRTVQLTEQPDFQELFAEEMRFA